MDVGVVERVVGFSAGGGTTGMLSGRQVEDVEEGAFLGFVIRAVQIVVAQRRRRTAQNVQIHMCGA